LELSLPVVVVALLFSWQPHGLVAQTTINI